MPTGDEHRHRRRLRRRRRPPALLVDADLALYRAKSLAATASNSTPPPSRPRSSTPGAPATASSRAGARRVHSLFPAAGRLPAPSRSSASRRWRAGATRRAGSLRLQRSSISPRSRRLGAIDRAVLEGALACHRRWRAEGLRPPRLSVNVSLRRLHEEGLIDALSALESRRASCLSSWWSRSISTNATTVSSRTSSRSRRSHRHRDRRFRQRLRFDRQP